MFAISIMKSLLYPPFFPLTYRLPSSTPLSHFVSSSTSIFHDLPTRQYSIFLQFKPSYCSFKSSVSSIRTLSFHMDESKSASSGEIHVIVGPMFAGKTSKLLQWMQSESNLGSFQVNACKKSFQLDKTLKDLCVSGRLTEAVGLLCRTLVQVKPETYSLLLQECIFRKEYQKGRRIHAQMVTVGYNDPNEYLKTKLLILYTKSGDLGTAHIFLNKLLEKSLISLNAMIAGYVQKGFEEIGLDLYYEMRQSGFTPDQYTFSSVFRACAALATLEHGKRVHAVMIKSNVKENVVVSSSLIDMYLKCSSLVDGHQVFDKCLNRNVITWTALISGYGQHGKVVEVLDSFHRMTSEGFRPNYVTFLAVLSACSHGGLVDEGWRYFLSMTKDYGIQPQGKHYAAMVDLLGRAGRLSEAYEFVLNSPCSEHPVIWGALLGACKIYGEVDLVKLAAKEYFDLEPENAGKYVVLANTYASFGLWEDVAELRGVMKKSGMMKEPGYSRIEVQGEVYFFFMGDKSHKQSEEIYVMIKEMNCILKDAGYFPEFK